MLPILFQCFLVAPAETRYGIPFDVGPTRRTLFFFAFLVTCLYMAFPALAQYLLHATHATRIRMGINQTARPVVSELLMGSWGWV